MKASIELLHVAIVAVVVEAGNALESLIMPIPQVSWVEYLKCSGVVSYLADKGKRQLRGHACICLEMSQCGAGGCIASM